MSFRKDNKKQKAIKVLLQLSKIDPLNHFINFEKYKLNKKSINFFKDQISNELSHESYLDLAVKYYKLGCRQEAIEVLNAGPKHPMIFFWLSYLDKKNQTILLKQALNQSVNLVFPHRSETAKMFEYFMSLNEHWKLKYFAGLIYWNKGLINKAKRMFMICKDKPDVFSFYLAKIKLFAKDDKELVSSLNKAMELSPDNWRVNLAWINYYMGNEDYKKAGKIAEIIVTKYPENSKLAAIYAKLLLKSGKYKKGVLFLENRNILPYEGATETRNIYHKICIRSAFTELKKKKYYKVIEMAKKAKLWPRNLGVGKPYDVDERLDNYLIAYGYEKLGKHKAAQKYYKKIVEHLSSLYLKENSKLLLQAMVLNKFYKKQKTYKFLNTALKKTPENPYIKWALNTFKNMEKKNDS